jgi:hypothetical protein
MAYAQTSGDIPNRQSVSHHMSKVVFSRESYLPISARASTVPHSAGPFPALVAVANLDAAPKSWRYVGWYLVFAKSVGFHLEQILNARVTINPEYAKT